MAFRIYIDGRLLPDSQQDGIANATITRRERQPGAENSPAFTSSITITGAVAKDILRRLVFEKTDEHIPVRITDDCCSKDPADEQTLIEGNITADGISWCEGCDAIEVEVAETSALNCLEYMYVFEGNIPNLQNPFVRYCNELRPAFVHDLLIALSFVVMVTLAPMALTLGFVLTTINALITVINAIIAVVNFLSGGDIKKIELIGGSFFAFDLLFDLIKEIGEWAIGCKYGHTVYYLRDLASDGCNLCNLTFVSSVFNDPVRNPTYYYTALMPRSVRKGYENYTSWSEPNKPLKTVATLLDEMATVINGSWWIEGNQVYLEPNHVRRQMAASAKIDKDSKDVIKICYEFDVDNTPASIEIEPRLDGIDWVGNEAKRSYQELVSYLTPQSKARKGVRKIQLPYAPSRFRDDGIERDVLSFWANKTSGQIASTMVNLPIVGAYFDSFLGAFVDAAKIYEGAMIMPQDYHSEDKWLVINPNSSLENAKVVREPKGNGKYNYNMPLWVTAPNSSYPNKQNTHKDVYQFFEPDDPANGGLFGLSFDVEMVYSCTNRNKFQVGTRVELPIGTGYIREVSFNSRTINLRGLI